MSKISELRLHARNRKLPPFMEIGRITPELVVHNLFIYDDLSRDPKNLSGMSTAEHRHVNAVAGVSTGKDVYDLGEFYNQIHTDEIDLPSYSHASRHESKETRVAILANFDYNEETYDHLTRLL